MLLDCIQMNYITYFVLLKLKRLNLSLYQNDLKKLYHKMKYMHYWRVLRVNPKN